MGTISDMVCLSTPDTVSLYHIYRTYPIQYICTVSGMVYVSCISIMIQLRLQVGLVVQIVPSKRNTAHFLQVFLLIVTPSDVSTAEKSSACWESPLASHPAC